MHIKDSEREVFLKAVNSLQNSFRQREQNLDENNFPKEKGAIGLGVLGISQVLGEWSVSESGNSSGAWLKHLENAINIGLAKHVINNLDKMIKFCEIVIKEGGTCPKTAIVTNNIDGHVYCRHIRRKWEEPTPAYLKEILGCGDSLSCEKEFYELSLKTQSTAFYYRLKPASFDEEEKCFNISEWTYSAREINKVYWEQGFDSLDKNFLRYLDSRDPGYCGSLEGACVPTIKDGIFYLKEFNHAYTSLWTNFLQENIHVPS
jgi:hypothetical protein